MSRLARRPWRLGTEALALTEFALVLPVITVLGMYGAEIANETTTHMKVSQIALSVADNASRMEQTGNTGVSPNVTETDINSVLTGATIEGQSISLSSRGRVILSSLEVKSGTTQYIHWQRCIGSVKTASAYGVQGATVTSMGSSSTKATAPTDSLQVSDGAAVMFVEVYYTYNGLFGTMFVNAPVWHQEAAFLVRDNRDLSVVSGTTTAAC